MRARLRIADRAGPIVDCGAYKLKADFDVTGRILRRKYGQEAVGGGGFEDAKSVA